MPLMPDFSGSITEPVTAAACTICSFVGSPFPNEIIRGFLFRSRLNRRRMCIFEGLWMFNLCSYRTLGVAALAALAALAVALTLTVPAATAQSSPTLTVTPDSIERPFSGSKSATLNFAVANCSNCWVALDPGWSNPAADQAVKGGNADFGSGNYWSTDVTIAGKRGIGPVPDQLGIKVRLADGNRRFIRFTLNDSSGAVAEAKAWLAIPGSQIIFSDSQQPQQSPQQSKDEYLLQQGPQGEDISCTVRMTGGTQVRDAYEREVEEKRYTRDYLGNDEYSDWVVETSYYTRPLRSGEEFRLESSTYRSSNFDFRWTLVSVVNNQNNEAITGMSLPSNVKWLAGSFTAPSTSFKITYRVQQTGVSNGASDTCEMTVRVR